MRLAKPFSRLSTALWFVPLICVLAGVGLSIGTIAIDKFFDYKLVPQTLSGGPDAALEILGTVAASMLQDKPSQLAIGIFVGTFAHAMLTLREVQPGEPGVVPGVAVAVAFVLVPPRDERSTICARGSSPASITKRSCGLPRTAIAC